MKKAPLFSIMLALVMLCLLSCFDDATSAQAAKNQSMKTIDGISWDLKAKKNFIFQTYYAGIGMIDRTAKITEFKIKQTSKKNKTAYITYVVSNAVKLSNAQIHKSVKSDYCQKTGKVGGGHFYAVVDYDTGTCLEVNNKFGVSVKVIKHTNTNKKTYWDKDGCGLWIKKTTFSLEITYPKTYTGLCFGIGGFKTAKPSSKVDAFFAGKLLFGKVPDFYNKANKKMVHFMRIK